MTYRQAIGKALRRWWVEESPQETLDGLAARLGVHRCTLHRILKGQRSLDLDIAARAQVPLDRVAAYARTLGPTDTLSA